MHSSWKPALFTLLNLIFAGCLIASLFLFVTVLRGEDPLALLGILFMDIAFLVVGILLLVLDRTYRIRKINKALPFVAFLGLTLVAILDVTTASLRLGIIISAILLAACIVTTATTLKNR
jgi:hypothetical protein